MGINTDSQGIYLKPQWQKVAARLQSVAHNQSGIGILSIRILINNDLPALFSTPQIAHFEPNDSRTTDKIISLLAGDI